MSDQKMETVFVIPEKVEAEPLGDVVEDPEKQVLDLVDTNPTIDDDLESDDEDAIVCYNFSIKPKSDGKVEVEEQMKDQTTEQPSSEGSPREGGMEKEKEIDPIVLQESQEDDAADIPQRNRKQSLDIITMALNQRKVSNLQNYNDFVTKRSSYYEEFTSCLVKIEEEGLKNINETETFGKELVKSLKQIRQVYRNFNRDLNKISFTALENNDSSLWGKIIPNGFKLITQYKSTCSDASKVFYQWLDSECISKIQQVFSEAKEKIQAQYKDVKKSRESFSLANLKNLVISKETKVKDLLCQQLKFNKLIQEEKNKVQEWGASASRLLETIYTKDSEILSMLKFQVASLIGHLKMIGRQSHHLFEAENYWIGIPSDEETMFNRIMNEWRLNQHKEALPEGKQTKMEQVHDYLILNNEDQTVGNLKQILRQLQINTYKVVLDYNKNDWKPTEAYFSVDNHLIFVDESSSIRNCMNIMEIEYQIAELELKIKEKQKGLFTTWNREKIKFKSSNQMEQFIMLIDSLKDLRLED